MYYQTSYFSCFNILVALLAFSLNIIWVSGSACSTPDNLRGNCVVPDECQPILDVFDSAPSPLSNNLVEFMRKYHCGFSANKRPMVCCPTQQHSLLTTLRNAIVSPPMPPNVDHHHNLDLLPYDCGFLDTEDRIVNGRKTGVFEFPWMVLLNIQTETGTGFKCGGTIINDRYILSAAHCLSGSHTKVLGVRIGEHNTLKRQDCEERGNKTVCAPLHQDLKVEEVVVHPGWNPGNLTNDIGLVRVPTMDLSIANIKPICLPLQKTRNSNFTNRNVVVTGWGTTEFGWSSPELLKVEVPVVPLHDCQAIYYTKVTPIDYALTHQQICAGGKNGGDSCQGDSGGPLQAIGTLHDDTRYIQQGIVSFGYDKCGNDFIPGVYTKVAYYMDWILDNIRP